MRLEQLLTSHSRIAIKGKRYHSLIPLKPPKTQISIIMTRTEKINFDMEEKRATL